MTVDTDDHRADRLWIQMITGLIDCGYPTNISWQSKHAMQELIGDHVLKKGEKHLVGLTGNYLHTCLEIQDSQMMPE